MEIPNEEETRRTPISKPVCSIRGHLHESKTGIPGDVPRGAITGLDPKDTIRRWINFAKKAGHLRVTGRRIFDSDIERIQTMEEEANSLFLFARENGLGFPEEVQKKIEKTTPQKSGAEHKVFFNTHSKEGRVIKVTFPGK